MLRAEEVRAKLPPEQWGPWNHQGPCLVSNNTTGSSQMQPHPTAAPHFFYCRAHLQAIRARTPTVRPWPARDQGRCTSCGDAAEPLPVTMADPVACVEAERTNSTVARLKTKRYCAGCNPYYRPLCRGRICRETGQKRRVQPAGCCNITSTSRRRHCAKCCVGAAANLVCSGDAVHDHRRGHRREKKHLGMNAERTNTRPTLRGSRQSGHRPRIGCECQNRAKGSQSRERPGDRSDLNLGYAPVPEPPRIRGCQARSVVNRSDGQPRVADPVP